MYVVLCTSRFKMDMGHENDIGKPIIIFLPGRNNSC